MTTRPSTETSSNSTCGQDNCGISGSSVDTDPRTDSVIDFDFSNPVAVAFRSNR
jgi:hypothetical protein